VAANRFELLVGWYLRFNGYFTTPDFSIHPNFRKQPGGTDGDVIAVRFPYSREHQRRFNFERDLALINDQQTDFVICEVKSGVCDINSNSWRDPKRENVQYAIRWMGFAADDALVETIAAALYKIGRWDSPEQNHCVRFLSFGKTLNDKLRQEMPAVQQILHCMVIEFLARRFTTGCYQIDRSNWDIEIQEFAELCSHQRVHQLLDWAERA
jgi:hypothetical protein